MPTLEPVSDPAVAAPRMDALFEMQLHVARRADELARAGEASPDRDRMLWGEAEREVLGAGATAANECAARGR